MTMRRFIQAALVAGVALFMMAAGASASTISYTTSGSIFVGGGTVLDAANPSVTLTYASAASGGSGAGVPSNISLGTFTLACGSCGATWSTSFSAFTFDLTVTDSTDTATGVFVGTSSGGLVTNNSSQVSISWSPLQLGPGTSNASGGNFATTFFTITSPTGIVDPTSNGGVETVQGYVNSTAVPEPATLSLIGGALLGLGILGRKKFFRQ